MNYYTDYDRLLKTYPEMSVKTHTFTVQTELAKMKKYYVSRGLVKEEYLMIILGPFSP